MELGLGSTGLKYVTIYDGHSDYTWLNSTTRTDAKKAALTLLYLCPAFEIPKQLDSDGSSHLRFETMWFLAN